MTENTNKTKDETQQKFELIFKSLAMILTSLQPLLARELVLRGAADPADRMIWSTSYLQKVMLDNVRASRDLAQVLMPEEYNKAVEEFDTAIRSGLLTEFLRSMVGQDKDSDEN